MDEEDEIAEKDGEVTGYVFHCTTQTQADYEGRQVLCAPQHELNKMQKSIGPNTALFLLNTERTGGGGMGGILFGTFLPTSEPQLVPMPGSNNPNLRVVQVSVRPRDLALRQSRLGQRIPPGPKSANETDSLIRRLAGRGGNVAEAKVQAAWERKQWSMDGEAVAETPVVAIKRARSMDSQSQPTDIDGRPYDLSSVIVNFANVGASYAVKVLKIESGKGRMFDWEGVRKCLLHLTQEMGLKVIGVVFENYSGPDNGEQMHDIPPDILEMCITIEETPHAIRDDKKHKSADDEMTIKCAYRRNCRFLDNDNYRDWLRELKNPKCRAWLQNCQDLMQMRYYFDTMGYFETLEGNVPLDLLVPRTG